MTNRKTKRWISGLLAVVTIVSALIQPASALAEDPEPAAYEAEYPALEAVRSELAEDEIVTAGDYEIEAGSSFDIEHDFSSIEIPEEKVRVKFHEAKNQSGQDFDTNQPDSYRAVYFVEPVSGNPSYHICRNIIVKEQPDVSQAGTDSTDENGEQPTEPSEEEGGPGPDTEDPDLEGSESVPSDSMTEAQMEAVIEDMEQSEDAHEHAEQIAEDGGLLLFSMDTRTAARRARAASGSASLVTGAQVFYPTNLGNYSTNMFTVNGRIAYCLESAKGTPATGSYASQILEGNPNLQKTLYYGYGGAGDLTDQFMPQFGGELKYVFTHIAASYFYCGIDGFEGCTMEDLQECGVLGWINYLAEQPAPPDPYLSLSETALKVTGNGSEQRTESIWLEGDSRNSITLKIPENVTFHNEDSRETQTGGNVRISGGTSFYFTAPMSVSGTWDTGEMRGSLRTIWKALVVSTGDANQDIGSYYEEESGNSVRFSVQWMDLARVKVVKVDSASNARLAGAVFGIYQEEACRNLIATMPATNRNGESEVEIAKTQDTVYLKEITAPSGYRYNATAYRVALKTNQTVSTTVPDIEQLGNLTIYKEGEVLTGAVPHENGFTFQYGNRKQKGAVFNVYAARDIVTPSGTVVFKSGQLVAENLETGADGSVTVKNLHLGTYRVTEVQAPKGFYNAKETKEVVIAYAGQTAEAAFSTATFHNDRQKAEVSIVKKDQDTMNGLAGGVFGLYASESIKNADGNPVADKDTLLDRVTTRADGSAVFSADLPIDYNYYVKEIQAPPNYLKNEEDTYAFRFEAANGSEAKVSFAHTFTNERASATIRLVKVDKETGESIPQGDASLEHAVYGLYARKDILHPDAKTGVLYPVGEQVATLTTDEEGKAEIDGLYLGEYFVKEITPPAGYLTDETEYDLVCSYEGELSAVIERDCTSSDQVIKQPFQIVKAANSGETDAVLLAGAGFTAYLVSSLDVKEGGGYDLESAAPVVLGANGETEIFTDENGYACSIPLPFGTYLVRETTVPQNYKPVRDFLVHITENHPDTPQAWRVLLDEEFEARLRIVKKDDETKKPVLVKNAEFKIYDLDREAYVEQVTTYPTVMTHQSFFTDEHGSLVLPQSLKIGNYRIEEVTAPQGYLRNDQTYEVSVDCDTPYQMDPASGDVIIEVVCEDHPAKGKLNLVKKGEALKGYDQDFIYERENLAGAEFEVSAAEDLYTADGQKDAQGNRIREYAAGELVTTLTTDGEGKASLPDLPLGTYRIVETKAPEGFVLNETAQTITLAYEDQDTPVVEQTAEFENELQKAEISVVKKDARSGGVIQGAVFGLYTKADIIRSGETIVKADTLLGEAATGEDGKAVLETAQGYLLDGEIREVDLTYRDQDTPVVIFSTDWQNQRQKVEIQVLKTEKDSDRAVPGTVFSLCAGEDITNAGGDVLLEADTVIEEKAADAEGKLTFTADLPVGFSYYVKEIAAAPGFTTMGEVQEFDIPSENMGRTAVPFVLCFENETTVVEFSKVSLTDGSEVEGAKLQVTDPDGTVVDEWISGKEPHIIRELEVGKTYRMTETLPAEGYVTASPIEFTVENTNEVQKVEMKDDVTRVEISKTDIAGKELPGAKLTVYDKDGKAVESWVSEDKPHYMEMLPTGEYTLHEESAPEGYLLAEDIRFEVRNTGEIQKVTMKDERKPEIPDTPKTGDRSDFLFWLLLMGLACIGVIAPVVSCFRDLKKGGK